MMPTFSDWLLPQEYTKNALIFLFIYLEFAFFLFALNGLKVMSETST